MTCRCYVEREFICCVNVGEPYHQDIRRCAHCGQTQVRNPELDEDWRNLPLEEYQRLRAIIRLRFPERLGYQS